MDAKTENFFTFSMFVGFIIIIIIQTDIFDLYMKADTFAPPLMYCKQQYCKYFTTTLQYNPS